MTRDEIKSHLAKRFKVKDEASKKEKIESGNFKTKSNIPNTPGEREKFKRAEGIAVKESGKYSEKNMPWGLINKIYQNEKEAGKTAKKEDVSNANYSKTIAKYK